MKLFIITLILINLKYRESHTWLDSLSCSCRESTGYPRGYLNRSEMPDFDIYNTHKIDCRKAESPVCSPHQTHDFNYPKYPKLKCAPGSTVSFKYNPNGHISKDLCIQGDPRGCRGNLGPMSYWYIASNKDIYPEEIKNRSQLDSNTGLNINSSYDDNLHNIVSFRNSYDINGECKEDGEPCEGSFTLPKDLKNHTNYQFIFYHIFDRNPFAVDGEAFSSCFTVHSHYYPECMGPKPTLAPTLPPTPGPHCD